MTSIWVERLGRNFEAALALLEAAIRDCTDELWGSSMWEVPVRDPVGGSTTGVPTGGTLNGPHSSRSAASKARLPQGQSGEVSWDRGPVRHATG